MYFYKGLFPQTAEPIKDKKFAFVHLDTDLYESTLEGLKFFYPRMVKHGIILSHDYSTIKEVRRAFQDFGEPIIELSMSQCLIVKV